MNIAIIFAGGKGERLSQNKEDTPKQFLKIKGKEILVHTLEKFENHLNIDKIYISILEGYEDFTWELIKKNNIKKVADIVCGGKCAQESIYNALVKAAEQNPPDSVVLIHDGVRPVIEEDVIAKNIEYTRKFGNAITAIPCYETIIITKDLKSPTQIPIRKETYKAQAPQSFILSEIIDAHNKIKSYEDMVDSCTLYHTLGRKTYLVEGNFGNIKVTTKEDVCLLKGILEYKEQNKDE